MVARPGIENTRQAGNFSVASINQILARRICNFIRIFHNYCYLASRYLLGAGTNSIFVSQRNGIPGRAGMPANSNVESVKKRFIDAPLGYQKRRDDLLMKQ